MSGRGSKMQRIDESNGRLEQHTETDTIADNSISQEDYKYRF